MQVVKMNVFLAVSVNPEPTEMTMDHVLTKNSVPATTYTIFNRKYGQRDQTLQGSALLGKNK